MQGIVEMFRPAATPQGLDRFVCPLSAWDLLWELAQAFGWQPKGTTYIPLPKQKVATAARRDYEPGDTLDSKRVDSDDAAQWAMALEVAKQSPHANAMINARSDAPGSEALPPTLLDDFIAFARHGAFTFSIRFDQAGP